MKNNIISSLLISFWCLLFFCVIYTAVVGGIAWFGAPNNGKGETVSVNGKVVGYALVGQKFTDDRYFNSRPSAVDYNAAGSCGSNKGPTNADYLQTVSDRIDTFLAHNPGVNKSSIPSELVTASGSGLDPDLSPEAALIQIKRIAKVRGLSEEKLVELVNRQTVKPLLGFLGVPKVNVLGLNVALDEIK
ncbi:MAG: K(+)-transporting ATPase subunit C [Chitinophagales bacterium]